MRAGRRTTARCAAVLACVAACSAAGACRREAAPRPGARAAAPTLAGVWNATFVLDAPPLGFDSAALRRVPQGRVHGTLAVVPNHWLTTASVADAALPATPTLYGTYDVDFTPFGFDTRSADRVPDVVGTALPPSAASPSIDSVLIVLGPMSDRGQMTLAGTLRADSVVGTWRLQSPGRAGASATGHFVLVAPPTVAAAPAAAQTGLGARVRGMLRRDGAATGAGQ